MSKKFKVLIDNGSNAEKQGFEVAQGAGAAGKPVRIKAHRGERFQLEDISNDQHSAPENVLAKRVGKSLQITFEGGTAPDLIIEDYYDDNVFVADTSAVFGQAENGALYEYIPQDPSMSGVVSALAEGGTPVAMALGGGVVGESFALAALPVVAAISPLAAGLGALGVAALAGGSSSSTTPSRTPDPTDPKYITIDSVSADSGADSTDFITNDHTVVLKGTVTGLSTGNRLHVQILTIAGRTLVAEGDAIIDSKGNWTLDKQNISIPDGNYFVRAYATDAGGTQIALPVTHDLTIDSTAPINGTAFLTPVAPNDTGALNDNKTTTTTPEVSGKAEANAAVEITLNGQVYSTTADANGNYSIKVPAANALPLGTYTPSIKVTDIAGNSATAAGTPFTVESGAPVTPTNKPDMTDATDSGSSNTDNNTNFTKPDFNVGPVPSGVTPQLVIDGVVVPSTSKVDPSGNTIITPVNPIKDGPHDISYNIVNPDGNTSGNSPVTPIIIDSTAPAGQTGALTPTAPNDSGPLGDNITTTTTPTISGKVEPGAKVEVMLNGKVYTTTPDANGNYSVTVPTSDKLPDATYTPQVKVTDVAGNTSTVPGTPFTVDSTAPSAPTTNQLIDNVGAVQGPLADNAITDDNQPEFSGKVSNPDAVKVNVFETISGTPVLIGTASVNATGGWSFTPAAGIAPGAHSWIATAVDKAGNESAASAPRPFTLVSGAPADPTILDVIDNVPGILGTIVKNGVTNDAAPTVKGTGTPGNTITITDNGTPIATALVDAQGQWTATDIPLVPGATHSLIATARDAAGQSSNPTGAYPFTLDTVAPNVPVISSFTDHVAPVTGNLSPGATTDDSKPSINGTAEANSTVEVFNGTVSLGTVKADAQGNWTLTSGTLPDAKYTFTAVATDAAGNASAKSNAAQLTVDTSAVIVSIDSVTDDAPAITGLIAPGGVTNDKTPTFTGKAPANSVVTITDSNNTPVGTTTSDAAGAWTFTPAANQGEGAHTYTATATNAAGKSGTATYSLIVDTVAPIKPTIVNALDDVGSIQGDVANTGVTNDQTLTFKGTAEANSKVTLTDLVKNEVIGTVMADASGNWVFTPVAPILDERTYRLVATSTDAAGNQSVPSDERQFTVDITAPANQTGALSPTLPSDTGTLGDNITATGTPIIAGKAEPGAKVEVTLNGKVYTTTPDANGNYSITVPAGDKLPDATYTPQVKVTDVAGNSSTVPGTPFTVDSKAPLQPVGTNVIDDFGPVTGVLADNAITDDKQPEFRGSVAGTDKDVSKINIYDTFGGVQKLIGTTTVDASGNFTFTPPIGIEPGNHSWVATAVDKAGNEGAASAAHPFQLIAGAPADPAINLVYDNVAGTIGPVEKGSTTNDANPSVEGTGTPGNTITITDNGQVVGTALVDPQGHWAIPDMPLAAGLTHSLVATAKDAAGQVSQPSQPWAFNLDTVAPAQATIDSYTDNVNPAAGTFGFGTTTDDSTPAINGKAEAGAKVEVFDGAVSLGTTMADAAGNWTLQSPILQPGLHNLTAKATDGAGNTGATSAPVSLTVDTSNVVVTIDNVLDNAPAITGNVAQGGVTNDTTPTLSGTATPNATVVITDAKGATLGSTTASAAGVWTFTPGVQSEGPQTYTATATNAAGKVGMATYSIVIDTVAPNVPTIVTVLDDVGTVNGDVPNNGRTNDRTVTFTGTAEANSTVTLKDTSTGTLVGTVVAGADGKWTFTPTAPILDERFYSVVATATDAAGNTSGNSNSRNFTVDITGLGAPVVEITTDSNNDAFISGKELGGATTVAVKVTLPAGTALNDTLLVSDGVGGTQSIAITQAMLNAGFVNTTVVLPAEGSKLVVTASVTDVAGNAGTPSSDSATIDTTGPSSLKVLDLLDDFGTKVGTINPNDVTDDVRPEIKGTVTDADAKFVNVYDTVNGLTTLLGTAAVGAGGAWSFTPATGIASGAHSWTVTAVDALGNTSAPSTARPFSLVTDAPTAPAITNVVDDVPGITGTVAKDGLTNDAKPTVSGTSAPGTTVTVFDNGTPVATVAADANGNWSVDVPLTAGVPHALTAQATDAAGMKSPTTGAYNINLDTVAPAAPTIDSFTDNVGQITGNLPTGSTTDDARPEINGRAEAGATVEVFNGATSLGTVLADASGNWTLPLAADLPLGTSTFTAKAVDKAGNAGPVSSPAALTVDGSALVTIDNALDDQAAITGNVASGGTTNDSTPTLSGRAPANSVVTIVDSFGVTGTAQSNAAGVWSYTPPVTSNMGLHNYTATVASAPGSVGRYSLNIDAVAPAAPVITTIADDVGTVQGNVPNNGRTDDTTPTISGTAEANATVNLVDSTTGLPIGTTTADANGNWTFTPVATLPQGLHSIVATATDKAGNTSTGSTPRNFTVDTTGPVPVDPTDDPLNPPAGKTSITLDPIAGDGVVNTAEAAGPVTITGTVRGEFVAGDKVTVNVNGVNIDAVVDAAGKFSVPTQGLALVQDIDKTITASIAAHDVAGNPNAKPITTSQTYTVDTNGLGAPKVEITSDINNDAFLSGSELGAATTVAVKITLPAGAALGNVVQFNNGSTTVSHVITAADLAAGNWTTTAPRPAEGTTLVVTASVTNAAGNPGTSASDSAVIDATAPSGLQVQDLIDDVGAVVGSIAINAVTDDSRPEIKGIVTDSDAKVVSVYDTVNGLTTLLGTASVQAGGAWSFTPATGLMNGAHSWTVTATDAAGNVSQPSTARPFSLVGDAPIAPAITSVVDDVPGITGAIAKDGVTNDAKPTVNGTSAPGSTIVVFDNGTPIATTVANAQGNWSVDAPLTAGIPHSLTAQATYAGGATSPTTGAYPFSLDTTAPTQPVIDSFTDNVGALKGNLAPGSTTDDARPEINGRAEAGAKVEVFNGATSLGTVTADANGNWTLPVAADLPLGSNTFTAKATDTAGNTGPVSQPATLVVDTTGVIVTIDNALDNVDAITGNVLSGGTTNDTTPTLSGRAPANSVVTLSDNVTGLLGTTTTNSAGFWTFTSSVLQGQGTHNYTASAQNAAGVVGTAGYVLVIDSVAPSAPTINTILDDVGTIQGQVAEGGRTDDTTPTITGKAEPLSTVTVRDSATGALLGTTTTNANGDWALTPTGTLPLGLHTVVATATDKAGNTSPDSNARNFIVDTVGPIPVDPTDDPLNPPAGKTSITLDPITGDGMVNAAEAAGPVTITGTVRGEFVAGDKVTVNVNGVNIDAESPRVLRRPVGLSQAGMAV